MAKCLVLGASGFIGSHLVDALVSAGHSVRAFDRIGTKIKYESPGVEKIFGDFLNSNDLRNAVEGMEYVFHFISTTTPATAENDPRIDIDTNVRMSIELFDICANAQVKRVIFASTGGAIYGDSGENPHKETDRTLPVSPYAIGKLTIEHYLRYFKVKRGLDYVVFRISNPYGERQALHAKQGVIPIFIENIIQDMPITVFGDGSMIRDYIYVKDVASIITEVFDKSANKSVYNVGSGVPITVNQVIGAIEAVAKKKATIYHKETPPTFVHEVTLDVERIEAEFNVHAHTKLAHGIAATYVYLETELNRGQY